MKRSQLNAISRSYTKKAQAYALQTLAEIGVDYDTYCKQFGYKGSPVALCTSIAKKAKATMLNLSIYESFNG